MTRSKPTRSKSGPLQQGASPEHVQTSPTVIPSKASTTAPNTQQMAQPQRSVPLRTFPPVNAPPQLSTRQMQESVSPHPVNMHTIDNPQPDARQPKQPCLREFRECARLHRPETRGKALLPHVASSIGEYPLQNRQHHLTSIGSFPQCTGCPFRQRTDPPQQYTGCYPRASNTYSCGNKCNYVHCAVDGARRCRSHRQRSSTLPKW